jgi:hypothetical protein
VLFGEEQADTIRVFSASDNLYFGKEGLPYRWSFFFDLFDRPARHDQAVDHYDR